MKVWDKPNNNVCATINAVSSLLKMLYVTWFSGNHILSEEDLYDFFVTVVPDVTDIKVRYECNTSLIPLGVILIVCHVKCISLVVKVVIIFRISHQKTWPKQLLIL